MQIRLKIYFTVYFHLVNFLICKLFQKYLDQVLNRLFYTYHRLHNFFQLIVIHTQKAIESKFKSFSIII